MNVSGVFESLGEYLNPSNHRPTSLVNLSAEPELNPFRSQGVVIYAKMLSELPGGNLKLIPAWNMLDSLQRDGIDLKGKTLITASSGNFAGAVCKLAKIFGVEKVIVIVSPETPEFKRQSLRLAGAYVFVRRKGVQLAKEWAEANGWINLPQYDAPENPLSYYNLIGPQIWEETGQLVTFFAGGVGTSGSSGGIGRFLSEKNPAMYRLGVIRAPGSEVSGVRDRELLKQVGLPWEEGLSAVQEVSKVDAYRRSLQLGALSAGPSSGFTLAGVHQEIHSLIQQGGLDRLRNSAGNVYVVTLIYDESFLYIDEYDDPDLQLGCDFPEIDILPELL